MRQRGKTPTLLTVLTEACIHDSGYWQEIPRQSQALHREMLQGHYWMRVLAILNLQVKD